MRVSEDIIPVVEFKRNASRLIQQLGQSGRPIVVTTHGKASAVVITPETYDRLMDEQTRFFIEARYEAAVAAEASGELLDDAEMWREIEAEFGPLFPPD